MERFPVLTRSRLKQLAAHLRALIYAKTYPVDILRMAGPTDRISYEKAIKLDYKAVKLGQQLGPLWSTFWFNIEIKIPSDWAGQRVDLLWNSLSEATLWLNGKPIQGLNFPYGERPDAVLTEKAKAGEKISFYVEMACNTSYGNWLEVKSPHVPPFTLERCEIGLFDPLAWEIYLDYVVLQELEAEMAADNSPTDMAFAGKLLFELNRFANEFALHDRTTWKSAHKILKDLYKNHNPTTTHTVSAVGHGHLDTAWLWPITETYRKCLRTWSNQLAYMESYNDYKFAASAAFHYYAMKERYPEIFQKVKRKVKEGQWLPVGGSWVEPDCNLPSGESLARQFVFGQKFFAQEFGKRCREFFNPDVFGYSGQLPQIMKLCAIDHFITSKLHENELNKPNFHTFLWQGIDGSQIITHFPPSRFFTVPVTVNDMRGILKRFRDHDFSAHSIVLFGHGDGGGGPTKEMIERLRRYEDLQAIPKTLMQSPQDFFAAIEPIQDRLPLQSGEIYFEYHRGTYTTQGWIKKANRKAEFLLHDIEFLAALAFKSKSAKYPEQELEKLWQLLLLNQMHDILPGSSIAQVYDDAKKDFAEINAIGGKLLQSSIKALLGEKKTGNTNLNSIPINTAPFARHEVCETPEGTLAFIDAPAYGIGKITDVEGKAVTVTEQKNKIILENAHLRAELNKKGDLISLIEKSSGREALVAPGNRLQLFEDKPAVYDAWQLELYHLETVKDCPPANEYAILQSTIPSLRAEVKFERQIGKSAITQIVRLDADARRLEFHCWVDWREKHQVLKVLFPVNVHSLEANYEIQFGALARPTHFNTPYDLAKFEVCAHKWADLSEYGFGVALLSESKYGFSTLGNEMRLTLLRAPAYPDPDADMGEHQFSYAIMPHTESWQKAKVVAEAYKFNSSIIWHQSKLPAEVQSFFSVVDPNLVLDTIKKAEDSNSLILRLYECHGARGTARLSTSLPFSQAHFCNILEDELQAVKINNEQLEIPYEPYQIITIKLID